MKYLLKSYYWGEKLTFAKLRFSRFKNFFTRSVFGELQLPHISSNFQTSCCNLKIRLLGTKLCVVFLYLNFKRKYDVLKSKSSCVLLKKNINFNKNKTKSKMENPTHTVLERRTMCFSSYQNCKLKVKLWWVGARERKRRAFFVPVILSEGNFFNNCVLSQYCALNYSLCAISGCLSVESVSKFGKEITSFLSFKKKKISSTFSIENPQC